MHPLIWIFKQFGFPNGFWQKFCHKKTGQVNNSYLKYALRILNKSSVCFTLSIHGNRARPYLKSQTKSNWLHWGSNNQLMSFLTNSRLRDHFYRCSTSFRCSTQLDAKNSLDTLLPLDARYPLNILHPIDALHPLDALQYIH